MDSSKTAEKKKVREQKYTQTNSKHFDTFEEADIYRNTLEDERIRVRRRKEGFDVVTYEKIQPKKKKEEEKKPKDNKDNKDNKEKKKPFKKGKRQNPRKDRKLVHRMEIPSQEKK